MRKESRLREGGEGSRFGLTLRFLGSLFLVLFFASRSVRFRLVFSFFSFLVSSRARALQGIVSSIVFRLVLDRSSSPATHFSLTTVLFKVSFGHDFLRSSRFFHLVFCLFFYMLIWIFFDGIVRTRERERRSSFGAQNDALGSLFFGRLKAESRKESEQG